ncbi:MAG: polysaccharide pyruvyl transferase family protein [Thiobacillus sp.]|nr:polysaccharide pyruvyl transferase family protein [Thiobacillus sp.]
MTDTPLILFGAFDRHNFGDLLLAHVAASTHQDSPLVFAGVAARDLRPWGGHAVQAIADLAREWGDRPADLCHVGGEILTCSLYEAAVMVLPPEEASEAIARYDRNLPARQSWAESRLGLSQRIAYMVARRLFRNPRRFSYRAVGGVNLPDLSPDAQAEVRARLKEADVLTVRDRATLHHLAGWGIPADLEPDPGEQVAERFGNTIGHHADQGEPADVRARFPDGYVAVQFSADFGDDATLAILAGQLDALVRASGMGICLFRAGAAPWHDDEAVYRRLMGHMVTGQVRMFGSLHLWDICALLSRARAYCGSSLHGRIVARAFGVPGVSLVRQPTGAMDKARAYCLTWGDRQEERCVGVANLMAALNPFIG